MEPTDSGYALLRTDCAIASVRPWTFFALRGEDRKGWMQGQITQDIRALRPGGSLAFCLASPTGQMEAFCRLWDLEAHYVVALERPEALLARIDRYVIMEDVCAEPLAGSALSLQGPKASARLSEIARLPSLDAAETELLGTPARLLRNDRTGSGGWDLLVPAEVEGELRARFPSASEADLDLASLEAGVPKFGEDWDLRTLPPELGPTFEQETISYSKGCYTGQEVLHRIHARGHTNRTWVGLRCEAPAEPGAEVMRGTGLLGRVTRSGTSPKLGPIAAAMVRNEIADAGTLVDVVSPHARVRAEVLEMPLLQSA